MCRELIKQEQKPDNPIRNDKGPEETFFWRRHSSGPQVYDRVLNIESPGNTIQKYNAISPHSC
jgi:hypothetical protein